MRLGGAVCWRERQPLRKNKLARFVFGHLLTRCLSAILDRTEYCEDRAPRKRSKT
jgi:hypothetical protein